jgi:hypothetical protein
MSTAALMLARQFTQRISEQSDKQLYINFNNPAIKALSASWQNGKNTDVACQLLKSMKVILSFQLQRSGPNDFHQALDNINQIIMTQFLAHKGDNKMDIWQWYNQYERDLHAAGQPYITDHLNKLINAICDVKPDVSEALLPEARSFKKTAGNPWLEVFIGHWEMRHRLGMGEKVRQRWVMR